jgi:hypothetical protein
MQGNNLFPFFVGAAGNRRRNWVATPNVVANLSELLGSSLVPQPAIGNKTDETFRDLNFTL